MIITGINNNAISGHWLYNDYSKSYVSMIILHQCYLVHEYLNYAAI